MGLRLVTDKKLAAVGVWAGVSHTQAASFVFVRIAARFIFELVTRPARASAKGTSSLGDKARDHTVEGKPIVKPIPRQEYKVVTVLGRPPRRAPIRCRRGSSLSSPCTFSKIERHIG
jgi:hypothetical protein